MQFTHKISKGTKYNQIYIPKDQNNAFEIGDTVEVKLIKKHSQLYKSKSLKPLSEFKANLIEDIFSHLSKNKNIQQIYILGSFLTKDIDYEDIDVLIISNSDISISIYRELIKKFNLKFHVLSFRRDQLNKQTLICPMIRSMIYYTVSNKPLEKIPKRIIDYNHIKFLLMMPQDLLEVNLHGSVFYDNLRRLITIERFLANKSEDQAIVSQEIKGILSDRLLEVLTNDYSLSDNFLKEIRKIFKDKIVKIKSILKNVKK